MLKFQRVLGFCWGSWHCWCWELKRPRTPLKHCHCWCWKLQRIQIPKDVTLLLVRPRNFQRSLRSSDIADVEKSKNIEILCERMSFLMLRLQKYWNVGNVGIGDAATSKVLKLLKQYLHFWCWGLKSIEIPCGISTLLMLRTQRLLRFCGK